MNDYSCLLKPEEVYELRSLAMRRAVAKGHDPIVQMTSWMINVGQRPAAPLAEHLALCRSLSTVGIAHVMITNRGWRSGDVLVALERAEFHVPVYAFSLACKAIGCADGQGTTYAGRCEAMQYLGLEVPTSMQMDRPIYDWVISGAPGKGLVPVFKRLGVSQELCRLRLIELTGFSVRQIHTPAADYKAARKQQSKANQLARARRREAAAAAFKAGEPRRAVLSILGLHRPQDSTHMTNVKFNYARGVLLDDGLITKEEASARYLAKGRTCRAKS